MATYKEIFGTNIEVLASDPANPVAGQVWYNSTDNLVKGAAATTAGAWATGGALNTGRAEGGSAGTSSEAALLFGGYNGSTLAVCESYDGTSWTEVGDLNTSRFALTGLGEYTSALGVGGNGVTGATETWNGTSWTTSPATLNTGRQYLSAAGSTPAGLVFGGGTPSATAVTEEWNGTSWTEVADLNTARGNNGGGTGTAESALMAGGTSGSTAAELWNGTSWTATTNINTGRFFMGSSKRDASNTTALIFGGETPAPTRSADTELWNGSTWTEQNNLSTARNYLMGAGISTGALAFGGDTPPYTTATEEWTGAGAPLIQTFTDS